MNTFTRPGFFFCSRNPHPKGNEYHTISCCESGIIHGWEILEGRDHPIIMGRTNTEKSTDMKMVGITLQLTRAL